MPKLFTVSALARQWGIPPRKISDLFYCRRLSDDACPVVEGRRIIPEAYVPVVEQVLRDAGILKGQEPQTCP